MVLMVDMNPNGAPARIETMPESNTPRRSARRTCSSVTWSPPAKRSTATAVGAKASNVSVTRISGSRRRNRFDVVDRVIAELADDVELLGDGATGPGPERRVVDLGRKVIGVRKR